MDGSALVGITSAVSLSDAGVVLGLVLLGWFLFKHIQSDREDRRKMYVMMDEMEARLMAKLEDVRKEMKAEHDGLVQKVDGIAATVHRLEGLHEKDK